MNEKGYIEKTIDCIREQTHQNFHLFVCVNQPEIFHESPARKEIIEGNAYTIEYLKEIHDIQLTVIDKSSKGNGWTHQNHGVGWARKVLFDKILEVAQDEDIIVSLDADTVFEKNYFSGISETFCQLPYASALSNPYYHPLCEDNELNRHMLRYELYMRYFALNLWRIKSPYCFTALGSAISFPAGNYRRIKGVTPKFSGEDFYLLQKLRKAGRIIHYNKEIVYPATRYSNRVFFGTGPALLKGQQGDWTSYPFYDSQLFDKIGATYRCIDELFDFDKNTTLDEFIENSLGIKPVSLWNELRNYNKQANRFQHAFHVKFDGLRLLQFLRFYQFRQKEKEVSPHFLHNYLAYYHMETGIDFADTENTDFVNSSTKKLNTVRDILYKTEMYYRTKDYEENLIFANEKNHPGWKYMGS